MKNPLEPSRAHKAPTRKGGRETHLGASDFDLIAFEHALNSRPQVTSSILRGRNCVYKLRHSFTKQTNRTGIRQIHYHRHSIEKKPLRVIYAIKR